MPRKLALEPQKLKKKVEALQRDYGNDILDKSGNLYFYCFSSFHANKINHIKKVFHQKNRNFEFPFVKRGNREFGMIYIYLLTKMLRQSKRCYWDDAIFIIYLTIYTGFGFDDVNDLDYTTLQVALDKCKGMARDDFKKSFDSVMTFNFHQKKTINNDKITRSLIDKLSSFNKKYKNRELVEFFDKISEDIIQNGL
jgi:hypothetical protein